MYVGKLLDDVFDLSNLRGRCRILDLCAAPGGKTTQILSHLSQGDCLLANEVIGSRVPILAENVARWGSTNVTVTNSDATAFAGELFDVIVVDAPCSGEGMFRKDDNAVNNWSLNNVNLCAQRQRRIVSDIWGSLVSGGYMIYSTCTFNRYEDEDNVEWICSDLGGEVMEIRHFYPGEERGEGFFAALIRKKGECIAPSHQEKKGKKGQVHRYRIYESLFPEADSALSLALDRKKYHTIDLSREDALKFLAREPLAFPDAPLGIILLTYQNLALGFVKNLGRRTNTFLPMPRRIRNLK